MALRRMDNGQFLIHNLKEAKEAIKLAQSLKDEILELRKEYGIDEMEMDSTELMKATTRFAVETGVERINFEKGAHATLIESAYDSRFIGTEDDLRGDEEGKVTPLRKIIKKKFKNNPKKAKEVWQMVTRRIVDKEKVEEVISEGLLTVDEVAGCFVEKKKAPYLRVFRD
jgi:hypothetical protein